ncbi:MFS transporter [Novosphingobium sp. G106]|uniref:MFS transporter n=1 Tax=Novosphingobium sp. G106 TaxID=2849500 RepID=UPI001C2D5498|nr:MFS transporter [Novosphingobium sp. G106]MBV1688697.1 MFS transporter [Novosphingobium sp. G106]
MGTSQMTAAEEWKRGWSLVLACFVGFSFFSVPTASAGVFMEPIGREFGWGRTLLAAGTSMTSIVTALLSPFVGMLIDRHGARRLGLPGVFLTAFAIGAISLANGSPAQWLALWVFYALISILVKTTIWTAPVSARFQAGRGLALALTLSGTAAAQAISPPLCNWLIEHFGWRQAYIWTGFGWGGVTLLLCWLFLFDAKDRRDDEPAAPAPAPAAAAGLSIAEAWRSRALWSIAVSTFVMMLLSLGLQIHQVPILTGAGVSRTNAAWLAGLFGVAGIVGKLITGALLDHYRPNWIGGLTLAANSIAFALLLYGVHSPTLIVAAILINGYSAGTKLQICTYLTASYAGLRNLGAVFGAMYSLVSLGSGLGPMIAGFVYDTTGGYAPFLLAGTFGCVFCGLLIFTLPRYPDWRESSV